MPFITHYFSAVFTLSKICPTYFKIQGTYFKICQTYFFSAHNGAENPCKCEFRENVKIALFFVCIEVLL